jgi:hypothetical protein
MNAASGEICREFQRGEPIEVDIRELLFFIMAKTSWI